MINKNFAYFRFGEFASALSTSAAFIAITWWILQDSNEKILASVLAIGAGFRVLAFALLNFLGDRFDSKKLLITNKIINLVVIVVLSIGSYYGNFSIYYIVLAIIISLMEGINIPIASGITPTLVNKDKLKDAMRFEGILQAISLIVGKVIGGLIISLLGILMTFISAGIGLLFALFMNYQAKFNNRLTNDGHKISWYQNLVNGYLMLIKIRTEFYWALVSSVVNFCVTPVILLAIPVWVKTILNKSALELGILEAAIAMGILFGSIFTSKYLTKFTSDDKLCAVSLVVVGVCILIQAFTNTIWLSAIWLFILGQAIIVHNISANTRRMLAMPADYRARLIGVAKLFIEGSIPFGFFILGVLINVIGIKYSLIIYGIIPIVLAPLLFIIPGFVTLMRCPLENVENYYLKNMS